MISFPKFIVPFRKFFSNYEGFKCRISILIVLVLLIFLSGFNLSCSNYPTIEINYKEGEINTAQIEFNGLTREFRFYIPNGFDIKAKEKHPLILILHGFNQPVSSIIQTYESMKSKADTDGTILVYPKSTGDETENTLSWNPLYGDLDDIDESLNDVDDVGYLSYLIDVFLGNTNCDPERVYVTGTSMGGAMTYALSCHIPERLAAVAPVIMQIGKIYAEIYTKAKPIPIMIINGTADP
jgi:polyhydroxybutyrate depolymerase